VSPVTILFVEDNDVVLRVVSRTLELEGRRVVVCEDGAAAVRELEGDGRYDLIIADDDLPGASGLELIRRARALPHRRGTPIIMFSSGPNREEAMRAGADEFLEKPEGIYAVGETVALLLATTRRHT
jgi:two-component system chemotaxis response regulator CheY